MAPDHRPAGETTEGDADPALHRRIVDQFSGRGERADVWRGFDRFLDTDRYLNLGYSPGHLPHVVGSSQRRLAARVGETLVAHLAAGATDAAVGRPRSVARGRPSVDGQEYSHDGDRRPTADVRLLDVGCGRGGPTCLLADRYGFDAVGVDLVLDNVGRARATASDRGVDAAFVVGDATRLPVRPGSVGAAVAVDSPVYAPDVGAFYREFAAALAPDGVAVVTDLVARAGLDGGERSAVDAFAEAWDMPPLVPLDAYRDAVADASLRVVVLEDLTPHSVDRFRRWSGAFLWLLEGPLGGALRWALRRRGMDPEAVADQVRRAHRALPSLRHVLVVLEPDRR